jgi:anti-sigma regulatory factor (Ser/Thr protein kinase)
MARFRAPLNANTIGELLQAVQACDYRRVDLRPYDFIDVYASVVLALLLRFSCTTRTPPELLLPESADVRAYLARQEFFKALEQWYPIDAELRDLHALQWTANPRVAPLTLVESEDVVTVIADRMRTLLCSSGFGVSPAVADAAWRVLSETLQNIPQHAGVGSSHPGSGFAALQLYSDALEVAIGDIGIGVRASLRENRRYRNCTDAEAHLAVLLHGATRTGNPGRGNGFQITRQVVSGLRGTLVLQSGNTVTFCYKDTCRQLPCPKFPGTQLRIRIPGWH